MLFSKHLTLFKLLLLASLFFVNALSVESMPETESTSEIVKIDQLAQSVKIRSEELATELQALVKTLPSELKALEEVERQFNSMIKMVEKVLSYLEAEGELISSLKKYQKYAERQSQSLRESQLKELVKLSSEWDVRSERVVELLRYVGNLEASGRGELENLKRNKAVTVELIKLQKFDTVLERTKESLSKVEGVVKDVKTMSDKAEAIDDAVEDITME